MRSTKRCSKQLNTAKSIYSTSTSILSQEQSIYQNALGDVFQDHRRLEFVDVELRAMQSQQNINGTGSTSVRPTPWFR